MDLAIVGVAVSGVMEDGVIRQMRIGLGSAAPVPVRAPEAEASLLGQRLTPEVIEHAARIAARASRTRSSHRASAEYRRMMLEVLVRRALARLAA
jgi:carbon-monoxide dehydrogenase medium subunit